MYRLHSLATLTLLALLLFNSTEAQAVPVGRVQRDYTDSNRLNWDGDAPRPLDTTIWYPAAEGTSQTDRTVEIWNFGSSELNAELAPGGRRPLVLVSHGAGGTVSQLGWLAAQLVQDGFIVAGVNHHGNSAIDDKEYVHGFVLPAERALDLSALLDHLLADAVFGGIIDDQSIGAAGFSFGGFTVLAAAGITIDYLDWWEYCRENDRDAMCTVPPEADFSLAEVDDLRRSDPQFQEAVRRNGAGTKDARIGAVFAIAPALLTQSDLTGLRVPAAVVLADEDDQVPLADTTAVLEDVPGLQLQTVRARHYTFLSPCTTFGRWFAGDVCADPRGTARTDVHAEVGLLARQFFNHEFTSSN